MSKRFKSKSGGGYITFYMSTTKRGYKNKRNRKNCKHYCLENNFCTKLFTKCVGPTLCKKFTNTKKDKDNTIYVGKELIFPNRGKGIITSIKDDICTVTFENKKVQCKKEQLIERIVNN